MVDTNRWREAHKSGDRKAAFAFVLARLEGNEKVIDVACGMSPLSWEMASLGCSVTGVDRKRTSLERTKVWREDGVAWRIKECDLTEFPWLEEEEYGTFDVAVSVFGTEFLLSDEAAAWVEIGNLLKPDGRFIYVGSHDKACLRNMETAQRPIASDGCNRMSIAGSAALAHATGFHIVDSCVFYFEECAFSPDIPAGKDANIICLEMLKF